MTYVAKPNPTTQPNWLRIVSGLGVLWYIFGFSQFLKNMTMDVAGAVASGAITEAHGVSLMTTPAFVWAAYFAACLLALIGIVQLFRGHASATKLLVMSLIFDVIYFGWFHVSGTASARPTESGIIAVIVITITAFFTILSHRKA